MGPTDPFARPARSLSPEAPAASSPAAPAVAAQDSIVLILGALLGALFGLLLLWRGATAALVVVLCAVSGVLCARVIQLIQRGTLDLPAAWRALWRDKPS
jgi:hypothetical protein